MLTQQTNNQLLLQVFHHPPALPARAKQQTPTKAHRETETESWTPQHKLTAYQIPFSKNKSQLHIHANPAPDTTTTPTTTSTNKEEENYSDATTTTTAETEDEVTTTPAAQQHTLLLNSST
jgi:hypothetical protein